VTFTVQIKIIAMKMKYFIYIIIWTGAASEAGIAYPSGTSDLTPGF
jgi:hypothetical protein